MIIIAISQHGKEEPMTEFCLTIFIISICFDVTNIIIKKMDLKFMDKKNEKEGRYIN